MPRTGGEADKLGNRYEGLWMVDAVLDLLDGHYIQMVVEPIGEEAHGIEFIATTTSGDREYHSIKRQHSAGNWTISRLAKATPGNSGRSTLKDLIAKASTGSKVVFSSGTSATQLEELTDRARGSDSFEEFELNIGHSKNLLDEFRNRIAPLLSDPEAAYAALRNLRVRVKNESVLRADVELRIRLSLRTKNTGPVDAPAVRRLIAELVNDRLAQTLTPAAVLEALESEGILPLHLSGDAATAQQLDKLNQIHLTDAERLLINDAPIPRPEAEQAVEALVEQNKSVMLEGGAGSGKSCVLAQIMRALTDHDVPCLAIRLDRLTAEDRPATKLGTNKGLPESPVISLGNFAGDGPCVICIDQLDAVSVVSARQQWTWDTLNELLEEARSYPRMRILFGCRSFDLEKDSRLRKLVEDQEETVRIRLTELEEESIRSSLEVAGLGDRELTIDQLRVLANPLHLYLFLEGSRSDRLDFSGPGELYERYWRDRSRALDLLRPGSWSATISAMSETLSLRESLSVPMYLLDEHAEALELLASHGVVTISDEGVGFFHESFFDYAFARTFESRGLNLVDWLKSDSQPLFRRSQVRQVLGFLRSNGAESPQYLQILGRLLQDPGIRFHIKQLVLDWVGGLSDPTRQEWRIIEANEDSLEDRIWDVTRNSVPWFDVLNDMGKWAEWLQGDRERRDRTLWQLQQENVLEARAEVIVPLVKDLSSAAEDRDSQLWNLAARGKGYAAQEMRSLLLELVEAGVADRVIRSPYSHRNTWTVLYNVEPKDSAFAIEVVTTWFDRQVRLAREQDRLQEFSRPQSSSSSSSWSEDVVSHTAESDTTRFARNFWPRFAELERAVPAEYLSPYREREMPVEQLREALLESLRMLAANDPDRLDEIMTLPSIVETAPVWFEYVALSVWSTNSGRYADRIVDFLLERPDERLTIDSPSGTDSFVGVSRSAIAYASATCTDERFWRLEAAILQLMPEWERRLRKVGYSSFALLRCLAPERLSQRARGRLQELERRFPEVEVRGPPVEAEDAEEKPMRVPPPVPIEAAERMNDDQWLTAIEKYHELGVHWRDTHLVGGASRLAQELDRVTRSAPERFAQLAHRLQASHEPAYIRSILRGLTLGPDGSPRPPQPELVFTVIRRMVTLGLPLGREVAWALRDISQPGLPEDMLAILIGIATTSPDPERDDWLGSAGQRTVEPDERGLNSDRGAAVSALASVLFADQSCWDRLKSIVAAIVQDPVLAVRASAVECLRAVLDSDRRDALTLFELALRGADPLLGSQVVEQFLRYAMYRDYLAVRPVLQRMLTAETAESVESAAKLMTLAGIGQESDLARDDAKELLEMGTDARRGAAEVYARNVADEEVGALCCERLIELFNAPDVKVREMASRCWVHLEPDQIPEFGLLLSKYVASRAFEDGADGRDFLSHRLGECNLPLPDECCEYLEQTLERQRVRGTPAAFDLHETPELAIRMHEETHDPALRLRTLDAIDEMMKIGVFGVTEGVKRRFER